MPNLTYKHITHTANIKYTRTPLLNYSATDSNRDLISPHTCAYLEPNNTVHNTTYHYLISLYSHLYIDLRRLGLISNHIEAF